MQKKLDRLQQAYAERDALNEEIKQLKADLAAIVAAASGKARKARKKKEEQPSLPLNGAG
jgi:uncharacterized coiled-coil DUF342 family protein